MSDQKPPVPITPELPSNSNKTASDRAVDKTGKQLQPIAKGRLREPSIAHKAKTAMFAEDMKSVGSYLLWDVTVPAFKQTISDLVTGGIERMLFGESAPRRRSAYSPRVSYTNYSSYSRGENDAPGQPVRSMSRRARASFDFKEILLEDRGEGLEVIERLRDIAENYEVASVMDLYELVGISHSYTDNDFGWNRQDLATANVQRVREGYILILPQPRSIK